MTIEIKTDIYGTIRYFSGTSFHREDGPAIEYANGSKEYWINGQFIKSENNDVQA